MARTQTVPKTTEIKIIDSHVLLIREKITMTHTNAFATNSIFIEPCLAPIRLFFHVAQIKMLFFKIKTRELFERYPRLLGMVKDTDTRSPDGADSSSSKNHRNEKSR